MIDDRPNRPALLIASSPGLLTCSVGNLKGRTTYQNLSTRETTIHSLDNKTVDAFDANKRCPDTRMAQKSILIKVSGTPCGVYKCDPHGFNILPCTHLYMIRKLYIVLLILTISSI
jgi:hypothetical protein